ncbi:MAG: GTPase ObgE [Deltaproteobacteria bacterium]|nr:GTPase ObgE [Deltaproteobacteria bacterium]
MAFVDQVEFEIRGGKGGKGAVAFRREKFLPLGGPSGGDGGDGGDVFLEARSRLGTLLDLRYRRLIAAQNGEPGRGRDQFGAGGDDVTIGVPIGTQIFDAESGVLLADLAEDGQRILIAKGGKGGRGNMRFATPWDRGPRRSDPGEEGESLRLRLELKLMADVGVVGFPNVGKSTFIAAVSRAQPKIADYPFTTLVPNLGVASLGDERSLVIADIPGIIEGASEGAGLGLRFLRHVERTRVLLHVLTLDPDPEREPLKDLETLEQELVRFDASLAERPSVIALSKLDLPEVKQAEAELRSALEARGVTLYAFSAATREGVDELLLELERHVRRLDPAVAKTPTRRAEDRPHGDAKGYAEAPESQD